LLLSAQSHAGCKKHPGWKRSGKARQKANDTFLVAGKDQVGFSGVISTPANLRWKQREYKYPELFQRLHLWKSFTNPIRMINLY
jgi:hypothetical protein